MEPALRGIIFSGDNPKLILEGRKTQTRRIIKPQPLGDWTGPMPCDAWPCPYGVAGDRLWVKETFTITRYTLTARSVGSLVRLQGHYKDGIAFDVTLTASESLKYYNWKRKTGTFPAIFMFRSLSRALLDLLKVGAERLQDISESDAMAEGIETSAAVEAWRAGHGGFGPVTGMNAHKMAYARLWDSLHGKGAWRKNPWVWVIGFVLTV